MIKMQAIHQENMFANHTCDKELVSTQYKKIQNATKNNKK